MAKDRHRQVVLALINTVFAQESQPAASAQWRAVSAQLREKFPKLAALMDKAEDEVLTFMSFPKAHRLQIHSTNPLERLNAEVKRRADVVGILPNDAAIIRLVGALLLEQNDEWQLPRRYMQLEGLQVLGDNQPPIWSQVAAGRSSAGPRLPDGSRRGGGRRKNTWSVSPPRQAHDLEEVCNFAHDETSFLACREADLLGIETPRVSRPHGR